MATRRLTTRALFSISYDVTKYKNAFIWSKHVNRTSITTRTFSIQSYPSNSSSISSSSSSFLNEDIKSNYRDLQSSIRFHGESHDHLKLLKLVNEQFDNVNVYSWERVMHYLVRMKEVRAGGAKRQQKHYTVFLHN